MVFRYREATLFKGHFLAGEKSGLTLSMSRLFGLAAKFSSDDIFIIADLGLCFADSPNSTLQFIALQLSP